MLWYIAAGMLLTVAVAMLIVGFVRDRRYLNKKTSEAMARTLWDEIQSERETSRIRRDHFRAALDHARTTENAAPHVRERSSDAGRP